MFIEDKYTTYKMLQINTIELIMYLEASNVLKG